MTDGLQPIRLLLDTGDIAVMRGFAADEEIAGVTTNPALAAAAGVVDYQTFCREVCRAVPRKELSLEVLSEDFDIMERQARWLAALGDHIRVKVPIRTTGGRSTLPVVARLAGLGVRVNVTAVFSVEECAAACTALAGSVGGIVSLFAGRLADAGHDPEAVARMCKRHTRAAGVSLLWASTRELFNVKQAQRSGCDMITVPPALLEKRARLTMTVADIAQDTVAMLFGAAALLRFEPADAAPTPETATPETASAPPRGETGLTAASAPSLSCEPRHI